MRLWPANRTTSTSVSNRCCARQLGWFWNWRVVIAWLIWCGTDCTDSVSHTGSLSNFASSHYKCQHGLAPGYLARFCRPVSTVAYQSRLRSAAAGQLEVTLIHTVTYGERNSAYSCPTAWNNLPNELKRLLQEMYLHTFKKASKTHFFSIARIA